jgi:predicted HNH restriction endonuclease
MAALSEQGFSESQKRAVLLKGFDQIVVEEGTRTPVSRIVRKRSSILRKMAIAHYADESGSIACHGCGLAAERIYGPTARGLIEIHHSRPLFTRRGTSLRASLREALSQVVPLCPNCHRMVHFDPKRCMPIFELRAIIERATRKDGAKHP